MYVSIIGDSISTFEGYHPYGYKVFYDAQHQSLLGLKSVYDTWWAKVNQYLQAYLCVNNSYSGSRVSGADFPSASCLQRVSSLHSPSSTPDLILVYIGFNDFGNGVKIHKPILSRKPENYFYGSYRRMLQRIRHQYPKAIIVCATLLRSHIKDRPDWIFPDCFGGVCFDEYNHAIRKAAKKEQVTLADLALLPVRYETLDGSHPTVNGHSTIAEAWIGCLKSLSNHT